MDQEPVIEASIQSAAMGFGRMLDSFYPAQDSESFCERNLGVHFVHAFLSLNEQRSEDACAFTEVPRLNPDNNRWHHHIDGYAQNSQIGVFRECKRIYALQHLRALMEEDMGRLSPSTVKSVLQEFSEPKYKPKYKPGRIIYKLALAECWYDEYTSKWLSAGTTASTSDRHSYLSGYCVGAAKVKTYPSEPAGENVLWWLYTYKRVDV